MAMRYIVINKWEKFQQYHDGRKIDWIKLQIDIINEFDKMGEPKKYYSMPDSAKLTLLHLLCLRPKYEKIPYPDSKWLKTTLGINSINVQPLVEAGFITIIDDSVQSGTDSYESVPEIEIEIEKEREIEREIEREKRRFTSPTLKEIEDYISEKKYEVDPKKFFEYFEAGGWVDSKGNKVKSWKQKIITWSGNRNNKTEQKEIVFDETYIR
jgi:hypothetical protein